MARGRRARIASYPSICVSCGAHTEQSNIIGGGIEVLCVSEIETCRELQQGETVMQVNVDEVGFGNFKTEGR